MCIETTAFRTKVVVLSIVCVVATATAAICRQQVNRDCASWYLNPDDGCPDQVTSLEQSHDLIIPSSEYPVPGWLSQQPESCLVSIQFMVREDPTDPTSSCVPSGTPFQASLSGLIGAGDQCTAGGGGDD